MTLTDLRTLLDYHYWARDRMLNAIDGLTPDEFTRDLGGSFPSIHRTLVHTYSAEWAWHSRWNGHSPTALLSPEQFPDPPSLRSAWIALEAQVRDFLETLGESGVTRRFEYRLLSGQAGASIFWHMLQHVVNHASYHRGQVTSMLRQIGAAPPKSMDLITYYREHHD